MAEAAVERASDLTRHAQGAAVGIRDEHHLEVMAVMGAEQPLAGAVGRYLRLDHLRPGDRKTLGQPGLLCLGDVGHRRKIADAAIIDPVPDLLGAQLGLPGLKSGGFEGDADLSLGKPMSWVLPSARTVAARGTGTGSTGPGIGIKMVSALMAGCPCRRKVSDLLGRQQAAAASIANGAPSRLYRSTIRPPPGLRASIRMPPLLRIAAMIACSWLGPRLQAMSPRLISRKG